MEFSAHRQTVNVTGLKNRASPGAGNWPQPSRKSEEVSPECKETCRTSPTSNASLLKPSRRRASSILCLRMPALSVCDVPGREAVCSRSRNAFVRFDLIHKFVYQGRRIVLLPDDVVGDPDVHINDWEQSDTSGALPAHRLGLPSDPDPALDKT